MRTITPVGPIVGSAPLDEVMKFCAVALVWLLPVSLLVLWFLTEDTKVEAVFIFVAVVVGLVFAYGMGTFYSHPAPYVAHQTLLSGPPENSFPSQHTTVMFAFAWPFFSFRRWRTGLGALCLATLVGVSRVYVGLHFPIDVVGGVVASLAGFVIVSLARDAVERFATYCVELERRWWAAIQTE